MFHPDPIVAERRFESYQLREFFNPDPIVAERLRCLSKIRPTRNQIPSANVGFNPDPIVAEQLRCLTKIGPPRNQIPSGSIGSNPNNCENFLT